MDDTAMSAGANAKSSLVDSGMHAATAVSWRNVPFAWLAACRKVRLRS